jgi:hypothetical protein
MNHNIVVCNKAHKYDACSSCDHADSHERLDMKPFRATQASYCTS